MKSNHFGTSGSLGVVGLGLLAMVAAGCADSPEQATNGENTGQVEAEIGALGWGAVGCAGIGTFGINNVANNNFASGVNDALNFIAVDTSDFSSFNSNVSLLNSAGQQIAVADNMVQANETFQSMFNTVTNAINAAQTASLIATQQQAVAQRYARSETQQSSVVQTVTNTRAAGSANQVVTNRAAGSQQAWGNNRSFANQNAFGFNNFNNFVGGPFLARSTGAFNNFNTGSFVNAGNFTNAGSTFNTFDSAAVHSDYFNSTHTDTLVASNTFLRTLLAETTASSAFASTQQNMAAFNQAFASAATNQATAASSFARTYVFNNLSQFASSNAVLQVNAATRAAQTSSLLRIFAGNQFGVTGWADFSLGFPGCI